MRKTFLAAVLLILAAVPVRALDIGDKAPEISALTWVTGEPADPTKPDGKTIYLVEVWSTSCPPCVTSIPILNDLQKRYADKGLKIVSFTPDKEDEVKPFLTDHPMEYSSFVDKDGTSFVNYMAADNRNSIPHAFLFNKDGVLLWIGNPLDNIEKRVNQVLDGTLNLEHALAVKSAREGLQAAFESQNVDGLTKNLLALEKLEPANGQYYQIHYRILTELGLGEEADVKSLYTNWYKGCYDSAEDLMILSMVATEQGPPSSRNPELGLAAAKRAYSLESPVKAEAGLNLADIYKGIGRLDLSIGILKDVSKNVEPGQVEVIAAVKNYYNRLLELSKNPDAEYKPE